MYVYNKKTKKQVYVIAGLSFALVLCSALALYLKPKEDATPVIQEEESMVITLPDSEKKFTLPYSVEAAVVKTYFDGSDHEVSDYTFFEGVYRPNQGIDYAYNEEAFDVLCMMDGVVSEVKEDALFGNSITVTSEHVSITYQSLDGLHYAKDDTIKQGDIIGKASTNSYNPELGKHLHIVCSVNGKVVDPNSVLEKTLQEIK